MIIEQTIEVPASRRITLEVPPQIPLGKVILTFTPVSAGENNEDSRLIRFNNHAGAEELKAKLRRIQGSLGNNTFGALDGVTYQRKVREEWDD